MIRQGFGHIVNTASAFGIVPVPLCGPYVASKFAVFGLTNALRVEAQGFGINATVVCPGFVKTEMSETFQSLARVQMMDVRDAAKHILSKVSEGKGVIVFPVYVRILEFLFRFFPWVFTKIVSRRVSKFRRSKNSPSLKSDYLW
jgi:short-subunit dehydrogenase